MPTLDWIGKAAVVNHHREVGYHLLRCDKELSAGDADAGNLLVQGDNLLALKALLPYYAGKVKCIYIDPPYNTGKENWVYNDNVNSPEIRHWLRQVVGKEGEDLSRHDKWLCMMYPRLALLKQFLTSDGAIFISIDDNEIAALRGVMDELFGRRNHLCTFVWNTEGHTDNQFHVKVNHEYIVAYARREPSVRLGNVVDPNTREESNLWKGFAENSITKNGPGNPPSAVELPVGFPCKVGELDLPATPIPDGLVEVMKSSKLTSNQIKRQFPGIEFPLRLDPMTVRDSALTKPCRVFSGWANVRKLGQFIDRSCEPIPDDEGGALEFFLSENGVIYYRRNRDAANHILSVLRSLGTTELMRSELERMGISFQYPKPKELIEYILRIGTATEPCLILDSFAGSGTTGHAVLEYNRDRIERRFILIELDESIAQTVTAQRLRKVIEGYGETPGLGGGFRFCKLGAGLFDEAGNIAGEVRFPDLAGHVFFTETGSPIPKRADGKTPLLGVHQGKAVYLLFNGVLGDKRPAGGNVLTHDVAADLPAHPAGRGPRVVYGEACRLGPKSLDHYRITFRQIPFELKVD